MAEKIAFGVDVGGSGIKGAPVNLDSGELIEDRFKIPTPQPATPDAVVAVIAELLDHFGLAQDVPVGVSFPGPILSGVVTWIANLDQSWVGVNLAEAVRQGTGRQATVINDADAAGYAEVAFGAAKDHPGTVAVMTLGTGIGVALITAGKLWPNAELGHIQINGRDAEKWAAASAKEREGLSYAKWARRLQRYFSEIDRLLWPDLIVVGGGISRKHDKFLPLLHLRPKIVPAALRNTAGIVGAAVLAWQDAASAQAAATPALRSDPATAD
ncbi:MAG: ROK family protein [Bifidobacteriaceae bacterium]|jgi:polyphosphate glucokinase|nr:ROK family protein [Bifidobacteriaceae bacterium]